LLAFGEFAALLFAFAVPDVIPAWEGASSAAALGFQSNHNEEHAQCVARRSLQPTILSVCVCVSLFLCVCVCVCAGVFRV
jgi:hypothetical protein